MVRDESRIQKDHRSNWEKGRTGSGACRPYWPGGELQDGAGSGVLGGVDLVLHPIDEEVELLSIVEVEGMSQRNQLNGLTLLQDAAGGREAAQMFTDESVGNLADLSIGEALNRINQQVLINKEGISSHFHKLVIRKVRLTVGNVIADVVLPCDRQQDVVQQVATAVANAALFVSMSVTGDAPLVSVAMAGGAAVVVAAAVTMAEGAAFLPTPVAADAAGPSTAMALVTHLDKGRMRYSDLLHHVLVPGRHHHRDVPRGRTQPTMRSIHRLTIIGLKLPGAGPGLGVGFQAVPVHSDRLQLLEGEVPGWF